MSAADNTRPARFNVPVPLVYVETTIPPGMTIAEYRAHRRRGRVRRRSAIAAAFARLTRATKGLADRDG